MSIGLGGAPRLGEIFYDEKTDNNAATTPGTQADLVNLDSVTFTVNPGEIYELEVDIGWLSVVSGGIGTLYITDGSNVIKTSKYQNATVGSLTVRERISTPGTYTRKGRVGATTQNATALAAATYPIGFRVRRTK